MRLATTLTLFLAPALGLAACGRSDVPEAPSPEAPSDVSTPPAPDAGAKSERPVLPDLPEAERATKAECEGMADTVFKMTEKELSDRKIAEAETILSTMRAGRDEFLGRCQTKIPRSTVACVRGATTLMEVKACGPNASAPPVAKGPPGGHGHDDHAGHDHARNPHAPDEKASEADCRAFVKKLDALMAARGPADARSQQSRQDDPARDEQQQLIIRQCASEAPASVIRCSLAAADLAGIDKCHEDANLLTDDGRPKAPQGPPASKERCAAFVAHFVELNAASAPPAEAEAMRARMRSNLEAMTTHCTTEVPAAVVECGLAARSTDELSRCDVAAPGSGSAAPPAASPGPAAAPAPGAPPPAR
jgi:hypothetical protein